MSSKKPQNGRDCRVVLSITALAAGWRLTSSGKRDCLAGMQVGLRHWGCPYSPEATGAHRSFQSGQGADTRATGFRHCHCGSQKEAVGPHPRGELGNCGMVGIHAASPRRTWSRSWLLDWRFRGPTCPREQECGWYSVGMRQTPLAPPQNPPSSLYGVSRTHSHSQGTHESSGRRV